MKKIITIIVVVIPLFIASVSLPVFAQDDVMCGPVRFIVGDIGGDSRTTCRVEDSDQRQRIQGDRSQRPNIERRNQDRNSGPQYINGFSRGR